MTAVHPLYAPDPRMEVRDCDCDGGTRWSEDGAQWSNCPECHTRGYVVGRWVEIDMGVEAADVAAGLARQEWDFVPAPSQDVIEVKLIGGGWWWMLNPWDIPFYGTKPWNGQHHEATSTHSAGVLGYPTEPEAVLAARCAYWGVRLNHTTMFTGAPAWGYSLTDGGYCFGPHPTTESALAAAIEAKGGE